jgi:hypothetical protein
MPSASAIQTAATHTLCGFWLLKICRIQWLILPRMNISFFSDANIDMHIRSQITSLILCGLVDIPAFVSCWDLLHGSIQVRQLSEVGFVHLRGTVQPQSCIRALAKLEFDSGITEFGRCIIFSLLSHKLYQSNCWLNCDAVLDP